MSSKYKMLVLEGGGFFGLIDITFLKFLEDTGVDVCKQIDSISGCSIGGIEACALIAGKKPSEIQKEFINKGSDIFERRSVNPLNVPWYSDKGLKSAIEGLVGAVTLGETRAVYPHLSVFVPALNMTQNRMKVWDNIDSKDADRRLSDVALDTSAACIYFPVRDYNGDAMTDGGLREVAPVVTHATGVKSKLGIPFEDMDVFVICAGTSIDKNVGGYDEVSKWGVYDWMTKWIINDITQSNRATSKFWGEHLGFNSFTWFNPISIIGSLDDTSQADYMLTECAMYKEMFLREWEKFMS